MEIIKDGTGSGKVAKVDEHNRLNTFATTRSRISFVSQEHQSSFMVYAKRDFVAANTDEAILCFTYTGDTMCFIDSITFSTNSSSATIELYADHTTIGGGTQYTPINLNRSSSISSNVTAIIGVSGSDGELDISYNEEVDEFLDIRLSTGLPSFKYDFNDGFILGRGDSFAIIGKVGSVGDKIRAAVYYFEEPNVS